MPVQDSAKSLFHPSISWAEARGTSDGEDSRYRNKPPSEESEPSQRNPWVPEDDWDGIFSGGEVCGLELPLQPAKLNTGDSAVN